MHPSSSSLRMAGREGRAMVVTSCIERATQYFYAFKTYLVECKSPYKAIVAFSGEHDYGGARAHHLKLLAYSPFANRIRP